MSWIKLPEIFYRSRRRVELEEQIFRNEQTWRMPAHEKCRKDGWILRSETGKPYVSVKGGKLHDDGGKPDNPQGIPRRLVPITGTSHIYVKPLTRSLIVSPLRRSIPRYLRITSTNKREFKRLQENMDQYRSNPILLWYHLKEEIVYRYLTRQRIKDQAIFI